MLNPILGGLCLISHPSQPTLYSCLGQICFFQHLTLVADCHVPCGPEFMCFVMVQRWNVFRLTSELKQMRPLGQAEGPRWSRRTFCWFTWLVTHKGLFLLLRVGGGQHWLCFCGLDTVNQHLQSLKNTLRQYTGIGNGHQPGSVCSLSVTE